MSNRPKPRIHFDVNGKPFLHEDKKNQFDVLMDKLSTAANEVFETIRPILKAGGAAKEQDREALRGMVARNMLDKLSFLSKDEAQTALAIIFCERIIDDIKANPWGGASPDLLS